MHIRHIIMRISPRIIICISDAFTCTYMECLNWSLVRYYHATLTWIFIYWYLTVLSFIIFVTVLLKCHCVMLLFNKGQLHCFQVFFFFFNLTKNDPVNYNTMRFWDYYITFAKTNTEGKLKGKALCNDSTPAFPAAFESPSVSAHSCIFVCVWMITSNFVNNCCNRAADIYLELLLYVSLSFYFIYHFLLVYAVKHVNI